MNVFKNIKEGKYQVELLKGQMSYIKDQERLDRLVNLINTLINLINTVEVLSQKELNTDLIDKLLLARFYSQIFPLECSHERINIHQIVENIDMNITEPLEMIRKRVISSLRSKELFQLIDKVPVVKRGDGVFDVDYTKINKAEVNAVVNKFINGTSPDEYGRMIDDLLVEFKEQIQWN